MFKLPYHNLSCHLFSWTPAVLGINCKDEEMNFFNWCNKQVHHTVQWKHRGQEQVRQSLSGLAVYTYIHMWNRKICSINCWMVTCVGQVWWWSRAYRLLTKNSNFCILHAVQGGAKKWQKNRETRQWCKYTRKQGKPVRWHCSVQNFRMGIKVCNTAERMQQLKRNHQILKMT